MKKIILFFSILCMAFASFADTCTVDFANAQVKVIINNHTPSSFTQISSSSDSEERAIGGLIGIINARTTDKTSKYYLCCTRDKTWNNVVVSTTYQTHLGQSCVFSATLGCEKYITASPIASCGRSGFLSSARYDPLTNTITYSINLPPKVRRN
jgi:hypothetical protein